MIENFASELDRYEREVAARLGPGLAAEARREMAVHLQADLAARLELGASEEEARVGTLAAIGDLSRVARAEVPRGIKIGAEGALLLAPMLLVVEWFLPQAFPFQTHSAFLLIAVGAILFAAGVPRPARRPWLWGLGGGGSLGLATMLLIVMGDQWIETGSFVLPPLSSGSWWECWCLIPMFGLPPLLLYRLLCPLVNRSRVAFEARWMRRPTV